MRASFFSFIGWLVFFRTVTWSERVKCPRTVGVALTMTYCEKKRFIPGFSNSPPGETSRRSFVLPTKRHYFKYKPRARPAAKRAWLLVFIHAALRRNWYRLQQGLGLKIVRPSQPCASASRSGEVWNHLAIRSF